MIIDYYLKTAKASFALRLVRLILNRLLLKVNCCSHYPAISSCCTSPSLVARSEPPWQGRVHLQTKAKRGERRRATLLGPREHPTSKPL